MNIQIHGNHMKVTDALQQYIEDKIGRLERYFDASPQIDAYVTLSVTREQHQVEVTLTVYGLLFRAEETSDDMYASVDLVADKLHRQIHKYKSKLNQRLHNGGFRTRIQHMTGTEATHTTVPLADGELAVVRVKRIPAKPMEVEEATLQMELLGHDFFVFTNAQTNEVNVVYRRRDGNAGLIQLQ